MKTSAQILNPQLDLSVGSPGFMYNYWALSAGLQQAPYTNSVSPRVFNYLSQMEPALEKSILGIHNSIGNADILNASVAIGSGATEVLTASLVALKKLGYTGVYAKPPHFSKFPVCTELAGLQWILNPKESDQIIEIVTAPNNPDGKRLTPVLKRGIKIYDLCYHWPQYGEAQMKSEDIMIFSLSKATGHAGTRVGWALCKNKEISKMITDYVFLTHYGVSHDAQRAATQILEQCIKAKHFSCFDYAKEILVHRNSIIREFFKHHPKYSLQSEYGLFALLQTRNVSLNAANELLSDYGIWTLPGPMMNLDNSFARISLGSHEDEFKLFLQCLLFEKQCRKELA